MTKQVLQVLPNYKVFEKTSFWNYFISYFAIELLCLESYFLYVPFIEEDSGILVQILSSGKPEMFSHRGSALFLAVHSVEVRVVTQGLAGTELCSPDFMKGCYLPSPCPSPVLRFSSLVVLHKQAACSPLNLLWTNSVWAWQSPVRHGVQSREVFWIHVLIFLMIF